MEANANLVLPLTKQDIYLISCAAGIPSYEVTTAFDKRYYPNILDTICRLCRKANQSGNDAAKSEIRNALGISDAISDYLRENRE